MQEKIGNHKYDRQDIADVFVEFYEELHTSTTKTHEHDHEDDEQLRHTTAPFTMQELNDAINQLYEGRAADTRRVDAEMSKYFTRRLTTIVQQSHHVPRATTTKVARHHDQSYTQERGASITVQLPTHLFDHHVVQTLWPALLRASTTHMDAKLSSEPASFKPGHSATDNFFTFQQLRQRATERHQPLWVAAIDFKKSIRHSGTQQRMEGLTRARRRGTKHTTNHKTLRPTHGGRHD